MAIIRDDACALVIVGALEESLVFLSAISTRELAVLLEGTLVDVRACPFHLAYDALTVILALDVLGLLEPLLANPLVAHAVNTACKVILTNKSIFISH